jgi:hypothetical protein
MGESERTLGETGLAKANSEAAEPQLRSHVGLPAPSISKFYSDPNVKLGPFVKAVRAAKLRAFDTEEVAETLRSLGRADPTLARTASLIGKGPEVIARWTVAATKAMLSAYMPDSGADELGSARAVLESLLRRGGNDFTAADKMLRTRVQNLLRLVLVWLLQERNLSPADALISIAAATRKRETPNRRVAHLLSNAKLAQIQDLGSVAAFFQDMIASEIRERQGAFSKVASLTNQIATLEEKLKEAREKLRSASEEGARFSQQLGELQKQIRDEKELRALDRIDQAGKFRGFMSGRINPPLSDARDALDFDPPDTVAARQRIDMAIAAINREMDNLR